MEPGETAPAFTLRDQDGNAVRLSDLRGPSVAEYDDGVLAELAA